MREREKMWGSDERAKEIDKKWAGNEIIVDAYACMHMVWMNGRGASSHQKVCTFPFDKRRTSSAICSIGLLNDFSRENSQHTHSHVCGMWISMFMTGIIIISMENKLNSKNAQFICTAFTWYAIKNSLCVKMCVCVAFMDGVNDMLEITLIEHERRLIQFDSISRAHRFCDEHLLNHIKLIELEECRLLGCPMHYYYISQMYFSPVLFYSHTHTHTHSHKWETQIAEVNGFSTKTEREKKRWKRSDDGVYECIDAYK